jgi:hypothetical protein
MNSTNALADGKVALGNGTAHVAIDSIRDQVGEKLLQGVFAPVEIVGGDDNRQTGYLSLRRGLAAPAGPVFQ